SSSSDAFFVIKRPVRDIAFNLENPGIDCEWAVGLTRSICIVWAPQVNRRRIKKRVVRFVWRRCWTRLGRNCVLDCKREGHECNRCSNHDSLEKVGGLSTNQVQNK